MSGFYNPGTVHHRHKKNFGHYLNPDEEMVLYTGVSNVYLLNNFIIHFLKVSLVSLPVGWGLSWYFGWSTTYTLGTALGLALIYALQRYYFTKEGIQYILTNKRLIVQKGFFKVNLSSANFHKVSHTEVEQGILDRMLLKHGRLLVKTTGIDHKLITLENLHHPIHFKNIMDRLIAAEKELFGIPGL